MGDGIIIRDDGRTLEVIPDSPSGTAKPVVAIDRVTQVILARGQRSALLREVVRLILRHERSTGRDYVARIFDLTLALANGQTLSLFRTNARRDADRVLESLREALAVPVSEEPVDLVAAAKRRDAQNLEQVDELCIRHPWTIALTDLLLIAIMAALSVALLTMIWNKSLPLLERILSPAGVIVFVLLIARLARKLMLNFTRPLVEIDQRAGRLLIKGQAPFPLAELSAIVLDSFAREGEPESDRFLVSIVSTRGEETLIYDSANPSRVDRLATRIAGFTSKPILQLY